MVFHIWRDKVDACSGCDTEDVENSRGLLLAAPHRPQLGDSPFGISSLIA